MLMAKMRENTKLIMVLAALAFVGLMVFEWGLDITGQSGGAFGELGRVNGVPVMYDPYMATYRNLYDQISQNQEDPITDAQTKQIEDQAWDEIVNSILIQQDLERRGIMVTDDEVIQAARFSPPPELLGNPAFLTDGQFDPAKYQQFIATADNLTLLQLEAYYRDIIPRGKLLRQVAAGVYLSKQELWESFKDVNEKAAVRYVAFDPLTRVSDDQIEISAAEVEAYYEENREDYAVPATASVISVAMTKTPLASDTAATLASAEAIRQQILDGEDFAEVAANESSDEGTAANGGDLGVFAKGRMVPAFDSAVWAAPIGRVTGPVATQFGVHLIEVTERWGQDSAQARHILLPFQRTDESEIALLAMADSLEELSEFMTLTEAAGELGLETDTVELTENFPLLPIAGQVAEGGEWAFDPEVEIGEVSPVFENRNSFYATELISVDPAGYLTLEEADNAIRQAITIEKKIQVATAEAEAFISEIRSGRSLDEVAREQGLEIRETPLFSRIEFVPGLGRQNKAVGTAFGLDVGEISDVVQASQNVFILERTGGEGADGAEFEAQVEFQRAQAIGTVRQQRFQQWLTALRDNARIVDRRAQVLNPDPDAQQQPALPGLF